MLETVPKWIEMLAWWGVLGVGGPLGRPRARGQGCFWCGSAPKRNKSMVYTPWASEGAQPEAQVSNTPWFGGLANLKNC